MEYRVRVAQITDIEAFVALSGDRLGDGVSGALGAADLLRQLVFLPHATVLVAERRRTVIGGAVLANCPCGTTLGLTTVGMALEDIHRLLEWIRRETDRRAITQADLLEEMRQKLRQRVLSEGA